MKTILDIQNDINRLHLIKTDLKMNYESYEYLDSVGLVFDETYDLVCKDKYKVIICDYHENGDLIYFFIFWNEEDHYECFSSVRELCLFVEDLVKEINKQPVK